MDLTTTTHVAQADPVTTAEEILEFQQLVRMVPISESVARHAIDLVRATRTTEGERSRFREEVRQLRRQRARGAVPGAGGQGAGADAQPLSRDLRGHPLAGHVPVLRHRILLNFHAESDRLKQDDISEEAAGRRCRAPKE